jgi:hypothetical protein
MSNQILISRNAHAINPFFVERVLRMSGFAASRYVNDFFRAARSSRYRWPLGVVSAFEKRIRVIGARVQKGVFSGGRA